uniref:Ribitol xylosyltransferase 1 n=1 Tax=Homo sapiens TaxID=9606 RepID=G3V1K2_HUMAN
MPEICGNAPGRPQNRRKNSPLWKVKNGILGKEMKKMSNNTDLKLAFKY